MALNAHSQGMLLVTIAWRNFNAVEAASPSHGIVQSPNVKELQIDHEHFDYHDEDQLNRPTAPKISPVDVLAVASEHDATCYGPW